MIKYFIGSVLVGILLVWLVRDYQKRLTEYNYHVCVEVYHLNANCQ